MSLQPEPDVTAARLDRPRLIATARRSWPSRSWCGVTIRSAARSSPRTLARSSAPGVLLALQDMQEEGTLPLPGSPGWDQFVTLAQAGDLELAVGCWCATGIRWHRPGCPVGSARRTPLPWLCRSTSPASCAAMGLM